MKINISILIVASIIFNGCASKVNFVHTPTKSEDFYKPMSTLKQEYSDIEEYDRIFASPQNTPELSELKSLWGEPEVDTKWTEYFLSKTLVIALAVVVNPIMLGVIVLNPLPRKEYVWHKGNYNIEVVERKGLLVGYEERVEFWEWEINDTNSTKK